MTTIGNIGIGLFILIIIWIITLIIFVYAVKVQSNLGWVALASATIFTLILIIIPTDSPNQELEDKINLDKDYGYIFRIVLLSFLILSAIIGFLSFFVIHCIEPIKPKPIKSFYTN